MFNTIKTMLLAVILTPVVAFAGSYTVSHTAADLGTISLPATISGTLTSAPSSDDGYIETITFRPDSSGTYRISTSPSLMFGATHTIKTMLYEGTIDQKAYWNGSGSYEMYLSSGNYYTIKLQMISPSWYTITKYSYTATISGNSAKTYTVRYNKNDGSGATRTQTHTVGSSKKLLWRWDDLGWSRSGYEFAGWAKSSSGSVVYVNGATVKNLSTTSGTTVNLYAIWRSTAKTYATKTYATKTSVALTTAQRYENMVVPMGAMLVGDVGDRGTFSIELMNDDSGLCDVVLISDDIEFFGTCQYVVNGDQICVEIKQYKLWVVVDHDGYHGFLSL